MGRDRFATNAKVQAVAALPHGGDGEGDEPVRVATIADLDAEEGTVGSSTLTHDGGRDRADAGRTQEMQDAVGRCIGSGRMTARQVYQRRGHATVQE